MKILACLTIALLTLSTWAQAPSKKPKPMEKAKAPVGKPVTRGEFFAAMGRLKASTDAYLGIPVRSGGKPANPDAPLTRIDIVEALDTLFQHYRPHFKSAPRPVPLDRKALTSRNKPEQQKVLEPLIKWGFVAPVGPLVVGPGERLNADEAGDVLGFFWNQLTLLTHKSIPRWNPRLEPQEGGGG